MGFLRRLKNRLRGKRSAGGGFVTVRDENGNVVVMDPTTVAYLQSTAPDPNQASLDAELDTATRVRVIEGGMSHGKLLGKQVWLDTSAADDLATVRRGLRIIEDPETFGHCMCLGDFVIELYAGRKRLAALGWHHGRSIRWEVWKHDALLVDGHVILDWLAGHGVSGPREAYEAAELDAQRYRAAAERWWAAMPPCLAPFRADMADATANTPAGAWLAELEAAYPEAEERALVVLAWFGQGMGPWNGYPSYEGAAEALLLAMPTEVVVASLEGEQVSEVHLEGAARYFAGWYFGKRRADDRRLIPPALKKRLLAHSLQSDDKDRVARAKAAFGP
jgi:hypothetical protein